MKTLSANAGRIIFSVPFLLFGLFHFMSLADMAAWMPSWLPAPKFFVILSGLGLIAGGVSILTKIYTKLATQLLAVMLLLIILMLHLPQMMHGDEQAAMNAMSTLIRDVGLLGALLYMSSHFTK